MMPQRKEADNMITITDYINMKAENLKNKLAAGELLCACQSLRFDQGSLPDYENSVLQDVYTLRYGLAYAHEYKRMYARLLEKMTPGRELEVVSLGCGNMVDYWSLRRVLPDDCHIRYHGVDTIDWNDKFTACPGDTVDFTQQDIYNYIDSCEKLTADIYIFPKSIIELEYDEVQNIGQLFLSKGVEKNEVHLLFSVRENEYSLKRDIAKTRCLYGFMEDLGMECELTADSYYCGIEKVIDKSDSDFSINRVQGAYELLRNLSGMCERYNNGCCSCCFCKENRNYPMLNNKYMRYQVFTFRKVA